MARIESEMLMQRIDTRPQVMIWLAAASLFGAVSCVGQVGHGTSSHPNADEPAGGDSASPVAACDNNVRDGLESDTDCGGGVCDACAIGQHCNSGGDCLSGECISERCQAPIGCLVVELCDNAEDDDCDGAEDEADCAPLDTYLSNWKTMGQVVDVVLFGDYPLYLETQAGHGITKESWGTACVGQTGSVQPEEETVYCLGSPTDFLEWDMTVPNDGGYVLMLAGMSSVTNNSLEVDVGGMPKVLPPIAAAERQSLLLHEVGGPSSMIFYLLSLPAGVARFRVGGSSALFMATTAVLARVKEVRHSYPDPVYPHLHFTQAQLDAARALNPNPAQADLLQQMRARADEALAITDYGAIGRERRGVLEALAYAGVLDANDQYLRHAVDLFTQLVTWLDDQDGDYTTGDILMYGYDLRQLGVTYDLLRNVMTEEERAAVREVLAQELMRHALSAAAGDWWRLPRQGGWTISHGQAGLLALDLIADDTLAAFPLQTYVLMMATSLRDNITVDGAYLQALGDYYGWDPANLVYLAHALDNNPGATSTDLWEFADRALQKYYRWLTYSVAPTRRCVGPFGTENCRGVYYADYLSTFLLAAEHYQDGTLRWLYDSLMGAAGVWIAPYPMIETLLLLDPNAAVAARDPSTVHPLGFATRDNEHVFMRTGWGVTDTAYMSRCGLLGNHGQREHGNIILYADGHNYLQAFNGYEFNDPLAANEAKSFVLIDGLGQAWAQGLDTRMGAVTSFIHTAGVDYQICDNSFAYNADPSDTAAHPVDASTRQVLFVRPAATRGGYFVLLDQVEADGANPHCYESLLHPGCGAQTGDAAGDCADPIGVAAGASGEFTFTPVGTQHRLAVRVVEPDAAQLSYTLDPMPVASFPDYLRLRRTSDSLAGQFLVVLFPEDPDAVPPRVLSAVTRIEPGPNQVGFYLDADGATDTLMWSQDGSAIAFDDIASDARVVLRREDNGLILVAIFAGQTLSVGSVTLVSLSAAANATWSVSNGTVEVAVGNWMRQSGNDVQIGGLTSSTNHGVTINGQARTPIVSDSAGQVTFSGLPGPVDTIRLTPQ